MDEIRNLFLELISLLEYYGGPSYSLENREIKQLLTILDSEISDSQKAEKLRHSYKCLFSPKSRLSEFHVWVDNVSIRNQENQKLSRMKQRLFQLLG